MMKWLGCICVAAVVGFVGSSSLANAAGIAESDREVWVPIAGVLAGFLTLTMLTFGEVQLRNLITVLGRTKQRPAAALVIVFVCGGISCLIVAVLFQIFAGTGASVAAGSGEIHTSLSINSSLMVPVTTIALLLVGATLIGIGIWGSIPPGSQVPNAPRKDDM
jgi:hypothetical protein